MRNLQLRKRHTLADDPNVQNLTACTWDGDSVICAYGPSAQSPLLELRRWEPAATDDAHSEIPQIITSFDVPCPLPDLACDEILSLYFLPERATICLVLVGGDIILVREDPLPGEEKIEIVGSVETGLTAAEWSPDGELLALVTRGDTLLFMTREFDNAAGATFTEDDLKASKHVSVGWGKKETQFTGRGARALRDPTMPEKVDEGVRSEFDDGSLTTISWRGDGQYLAINSLQSSLRRVIRIYSREGVLDGASEPVDFLEGALSWRPAGNLIASIQRRSDRVDVVFFERNGLRHGEFSLRPIPRLNGGPEPMSSITLQWNCDSTVLAVCLADRIQFWTMGNYHYYLKQEVITWPQLRNGRLSLCWHSENPLKYIYTAGRSLEMLQYFQVVSRSPTWDTQTGTVAVIDGQVLKLTSLRYANVPPPMAQDEVILEHNIVAVAVHTTDGDEQIAVIDARRLSLFTWKPQRKERQQPHLLGFIDLIQTDDTEENQQHGFHTVTFQNGNCVLLLGGTGIESVIRKIDFALDHRNPHITEKQASRVSSIVASFGTTNNEVYEVSPTGIIKRYEEDPISISNEKPFRLPKEVEAIDIIDIASTSSIDQFSTEANGNAHESIAFGCTRNGALYANSRCLTRDCTSFAVTFAHLVFTTSKHLLKFVHLDQAEELFMPPDTPEVDERCRSVERGARIVTIIPTTAAVVLQMPRGNLETIFPRALVLAEIRKHIDDMRYKKAFMVCRKQRVDMNILFDYKPHQFLNNVASFIDQVQKVEHIDLFLSQLRNEDVSISMYRDTLPKKEAEQVGKGPVSEAQVPGKVNRVSDAFIGILRQRTTTNMQNIITAHVVKSPPDIEAGLLEVAKFKKIGEKEGERAVEHICFLVDVNKLYDSALGLYDLQLTISIAQKSQKDPREYVPFLQRFQSLPELRRKHAIDDSLGRNRKALASLWELGEFEEYKKYTLKHELYEEALQACRYDESKYREAMKLFAEHLQRKMKHREAGIAFEYLQDYDSASESYRLAHMWRESLSSACMASWKDDRLQSLAGIIRESLVVDKEFHAAALVTRDYLHDFESAARLFCRGYLFADAIALLSLQGRSHLIAEIVDAGLTECMGATTELLADCKSQLNAQVPRIRELRIKKAEEPLAYYEGTDNAGPDIPDNISLAATDASTMGGSLFTRYTGKNSGTIGTNATRKTAKNKRKEERKRAKGKKGSVYEEEYLVNSIGRLIERVNSVSEDVRRLVVGLMRRGMRERARAVETAMTEVVHMCTQSRDEILQAEKPIREQQGHQQQAENEDTVGEEPSSDLPTVQKWERLAFLGHA